MSAPEFYYYQSKIYIPRFERAISWQWQTLVYRSIQLNASYVLFGIPNSDEDTVIDTLSLCIYCMPSCTFTHVKERICVNVSVMLFSTS